MIKIIYNLRDNKFYVSAGNTELGISNGSPIASHTSFQNMCTACALIGTTASCDETYYNLSLFTSLYQVVADSTYIGDYVGLSHPDSRVKSIIRDSVWVTTQNASTSLLAYALTRPLRRTRG